MTRKTKIAIPGLLIAAALTQPPLHAQQPVEPVAPMPAPPTAPTTEWAVAPAGVVLPEGTVLQEGVVLPPGTVLPGGAILPGQASQPPLPVAAPEPVPVPEPAPIPVPVPETLPAPIPIPAPESPPLPTLPGQSTLGVPHVSGGIGASEREEMEQIKAQYNLRLLFAIAGSGAYVSNVRVQIQDVAGPVLLTTVTVGPWLYANLAPGSYQLTAEYAGQVQTKQVIVPPTGAASEAFYWAAP